MFEKYIDKHLFVLYTEYIKRTDVLMCKGYYKGGIDMKKNNKRNGKRAQKRLRTAILAMFTFVFVTALSGYFGGMLTSAHNSADEEICYISIEIQPGDTLWSIAEEYMPDEYGSVAEYVSELKKLNSLHSSDIHAEQYLLVASVK